MSGKTRPRPARARWSHRLWLGAGAVALAATGVAVTLAVVLSGSGTTAPRARQYLAYAACLLTGPDGLAGAAAAQAWAGMEDASAATRAKVEYLPVSGTTTAAARPYVASLVQRHCDIVLAIGGPQVAAVTADAVRYANVRFVVVGGMAAAPNVTAVGSPSGQVRTAVDRVVTGAAQTAAN